ncbi:MULTISPECIES: YaiO family outer membrane beta-barrel protein [unclassified Flavobacterium]|uniref:YaiO family outer membrane beta-barrel protein n=1 Tax=unclassified Flavobacterium TaxID=196869 RepID=UPI003F930721
MISKIANKLTFILLFCAAVQMQAQENKYNGNPDTSFETARKLAFNEQRAQAQDTLRNILTKYPDYHDIRTFLATTYSWDGDYKKARKEFAYVLDKDPKNKPTWIAAIKNENWSEAPFTALEMAKKALKIFPADPELAYLKATAEQSTNNPIEALNTIDAILEKNPYDENALSFKSSLGQTLRKNTIGVTAAVDLYSEVFDPMQYYTLNYTRQTKYGSIITKFNFNRRFNENGTQIEFDLYPKITEGLYAYLNFGFANTFLFPDLRYGAELYKTLPHSFEASIGFRSLQYSTTTNIYTGSIGWYTGNSYLSFRPYFTTGDNGTSTSGTFTYRKYRSDADNYFGVAFGMGFSPEINQFNFGANENTIVDLKSQKLNLGYYFTSANKKNAWGAQFGVTHQEITFDQGNYFWIYNIALSWDIRFK